MKADARRPNCPGTLGRGPASQGCAESLARGAVDRFGPHLGWRMPHSPRPRDYIRLDDFGWIADNDGTGRHVLHDNAIWRYNAIVPNLYSCHDDRAGSDKTIASNKRILVFLVDENMRDY